MDYFNAIGENVETIYKLWMNDLFLPSALKTTGDVQMLGGDMQNICGVL